MRVSLFFLILSLVWISPMLAQSIDLSRPKDYLDAFMRIRGTSDGSVSLYHWTGSIYSFIPGEKRMELMAFEGFNIAKTIPTEAGFKLLTREAAFYKDHRSGEILETWRNPLTNSDVKVVHIWNDPVNQDMDFGADMLPYARQILPSTDLGDKLAFHMDIFPFYTSPLPRKEFGEYSQSDTYQAAEFFQFFADKADILNPSLGSIPATITWHRISPWMPFMKMGDRAGSLVFVCRGRKLEGGFEALPKHIKDYVMANKPEYAAPPEEWSEPNETSWTYFKKLWEQGLIESEQ